MILINPIKNIVIRPFVPIEWTVNTKVVYDAGLTPETIGNFSITKHLYLNNEVVDLNSFNDIFIDNKTSNHQYIDCDFDNVAININNKEISPQYEYCLNKNINQSELQTTVDDCNNARNLTKYEEYTKYGKVYFTLPPIASESIVNVGKSFSYCGTIPFSLSGKTNLQLKDISLSEQSSNDIGEVCDGFVLKTDDQSNNAYTKFDSVNVNIKDFNLKSGSDFKNKKSLSGTVNDSSKTTDFFADTFRTHFNEYKQSFKIKYPFSGNYTQVSQTFDGVLFKNFTYAQIQSMTSPVGESTIKELEFSPYLNKNFFKFIPSGIHRVGVKEYYSGTTSDISISYETKYVNMTDFNNRGSFDYIYKNMIRPILIKYQTITKSGTTFVSSVTDKILPEVAQSFKFQKDYILKRIKPYFKAVGDTYSSNIAVYFGFLINGKIHENGIIHTEILSYDDLIDGYDLPLPIHIPADKEFFIGFLTISSESESIELKYIENGQYDTNGYLVSFPSDIQTTMIDGSTQYTNRMIKMDLDVHVYDVEENITEQSDDNFYNPLFQSTAEYTSSVEIETVPMVIDLNRFMFFGNDIIPSSSNLEYKFGTPFTVTSVNGQAVNPYTDYSYFTINPNDEYVLSKTTNNYKFKYSIQTYDKYQSPILKPLEYNYVLKKYVSTETTKYVMNEPFIAGVNNLIGYSPITYNGTSFRLQLKNLNGVYKSEYYDDFMKNSKFYSGDTNIDETGFVIRIVFDYFQQGIEQTYMKTHIPMDVKATNKLTGRTYRCYTSSLAFKQNNKINNPLGITSTSEILLDGWKKKTIEFIPFLLDETNNRFFKIKNVEEWDFDIEIVVENTSTLNTLIRNIRLSVDSVIVDMNIPSLDIIKPIIPPIKIENLTNTLTTYFTAPTVIQVTPDVNP